MTAIGDNISDSGSVASSSSSKASIIANQASTARPQVYNASIFDRYALVRCPAVWKRPTTWSS